jgi:hypothetical protein
VPVWDGADYCDPDTGEVLPTWQAALDRAEADPEAEPTHVMRFGAQVDMAGIIAPSPDADRAVRYLTKYLTKSMAATCSDDEPSPLREAHVDRLHQELRFLPCSPAYANWLHYGVQPDQPGPGLRPGRCASPAHDAGVILEAVIERARWRAQYEDAKAALVPVDFRSATGSETGPDG